jgi:acyl-CoA thioesterase FadM
VAEDNWGVTARMSIEYRRPMPIGQPVRAEGWIVRSRRRLVDTAGRIVAGDGTVLATAEGRYVAADEARKRELQARYGYRARAARDTTDGLPEPVDG